MLDQVATEEVVEEATETKGKLFDIVTLWWQTISKFDGSYDNIFSFPVVAEAILEDVVVVVEAEVALDVAEVVVDVEAEEMEEKCPQKRS